MRFYEGFFRIPQDFTSRILLGAASEISTGVPPGVLSMILPGVVLGYSPFSNFGILTRISSGIPRRVSSKILSFARISSEVVPDILQEFLLKFQKKSVVPYLLDTRWIEALPRSLVKCHENVM